MPDVPPAVLGYRTHNLCHKQISPDQNNLDLVGTSTMDLKKRSSHLILPLLMSSMVKEEYSLSSWGSCCSWLLVRIPYIGTDTS